MNYNKKIIIAAIFVIISITIAYTVEAYTGMTKINDKVIRLHVVANSDTVYDQQLKYKVRNKIVNKFNNEFENISSKDESEDVIITKINDIRAEAEEIINDEGYDYEVNVYYGNFKFPRKMYEDIVLPEGYYDAVRIEIGKAEGNNWWCVMFPPLCFVDFGKDKKAEPSFDIETERKLQEVLTAEEIEAIKTKRGLEDIKLKSKLFEFIEKGMVENTGIYSTDKTRTYAEATDK
ncbi:stage II sporulation protein R [Sedimentibacter hydroxybenzoicus DSM 7310]|uniref:Stage II sporulation protein R n=1 Tax=Sedimentibacter hydroxybenzoicus DSM 7310 TaxID=1123245 RepID=A0A974BL90_SEDHY|nr:stage II sporulation protein R [Sedimentibacter hydroxybenzoicus]NYB75419.1 stage II sporulation protein R [Sedimentibacter hydroxybenzoicus DSM 7310]